MATAVAAGAVAASGFTFSSAEAAASDPKKVKFMEEATRLAIESVEKAGAGRSALSSSRMGKLSVAARTASS